ncbi:MULTISPECIES: type VI secretion system baseplate subunit TssK [unclassified Motilimonas]|uniref:type VI secretion system baseplate subunit TssK n=1 Tax=unclassified Motilimonas TaxID=2643697 RepID=UPI001E62476D|nr:MULTISPECIES: type VI secretion system baseplate subunit TssK [unclassified Motilimonas]MCE0559222.1 type VI secretion system baseplate subunit TssK [Motilimonas sp. E26]MDO6527517.1 type VI secretion system baseplate subunit TssK [Motilimonas sp. 1_MG-2023]
MSVRNRVIWKEGLFIKPQHFQQQQRHNEYLIEQRTKSVSPYAYGITELELNPEYLSFGRIALQKAAGVMPDGTVFNIPQEDLSPAPLDISEQLASNQLVFLAIPLRSESVNEVAWPDAQLSCRYKVDKQQTKDIHSDKGDFTDLEVGKVDLKLMLEQEDRSGYASMSIARIIQKRPDGSLLMDQEFIPCHTNSNSVPRLHQFLSEAAGLLAERAKNIATRIGSPGQSGVADVSDFMSLQMLNRESPVLNHLANLRAVHPERVYEKLASVCGELFTFTDDSRIAPIVPPYNHDLPSQSLNEVMSLMRQALSIVLEPKAVSLQLQNRQYGLMVAPITDTSLPQQADFILAVKARMPLEQLRKLFVQQTKISSSEKIRELISLQLPGVPLISLPVAPRQLPYHSGFIYFQLDKSNPAWEVLRNASGFAFHVAGNFPELEMQFWAIRS